MTICVTVFFATGEERNFTDETDRLFDYVVTEGHLSITESLRRQPGRIFKKPRALHVFPPGTWIEVAVDYGS